MTHSRYISLCIAALALSLTGCANPKVVYAVVTGPNANGDRVFRFSESVVNFAYATQSGPVGAATDFTRLTMSSAPVEHTAVTYTLSGTDWYQNWGVETDLSSTRVGDTKLLKSVGSKITDERATLLGTAASIAANSLAMVAAGQVATPPVAATGVAPTGISVEKFLTTTIMDPKCRPDGGKAGDKVSRDGTFTCTGLELVGGWYSPDGTAASQVKYKLDISFDAVPIDAFKVSSVTFPYTTGALLYSACRTAHLTVTNAALGTDWKAEASVVVADSNWFEATAFPPNGTVTTGVACGADSASNAYTEQTPLDYLKAASDAAKTVKDQLDKNSSSGAK